MRNIKKNYKNKVISPEYYHSNYKLFRFCQAVQVTQNMLNCLHIFYKTPDESQELIHHGKLNIGEKLEDIWEVTSSNYTYDYKLINDKPSLFELLPEAENVDISRLREKLSALSKIK